MNFNELEILFGRGLSFGKDLISWGSWATVGYLAGAVSCEHCNIPKRALTLSDGLWIAKRDLDGDRFLEDKFLKGSLTDVLAYLHLDSDLFFFEHRWWVTEQPDFVIHHDCDRHLRLVSEGEQVNRFNPNQGLDYVVKDGVFQPEYRFFPTEIPAFEELAFLKNPEKFFQTYKNLLDLQISYVKRVYGEKLGKETLEKIDSQPSPRQLVDYLFSS